ncbi:MAG: hypothetical protein ACJ790_17950 [Myxococcaceae bacterium]
MFGSRLHIVTGLLVFALLLQGCGNHKDDFISGRVQDKCDGTWPICDSFAGCLLGPQSYVEGRFPNHGKFVVQVPEPSTVRVHVFLEEIGAAGEQTSFTFYEDRCRSKTRLDTTGKEFVAEAQRSGEFVQEAELVGVGDHLIEFASDAQARYDIKVEVLPKRLQTSN